MSRNPLEALFGNMREEEDGSRERSYHRTPPDVLCVTLREVADRYAAPCPFKPGDLVTPRRGYNVSGAGEPHVVVEVLSKPRFNFEVSKPNDIGSQAYGWRIDIRVICETGEEIVPFWGESWKYEPYTGSAANV